MHPAELPSMLDESCHPRICIDSKNRVPSSCIVQALEDFDSLSLSARHRLFEGRHATQVIKGSYTQTDQLQGYNALAPTASSNLTSSALRAPRGPAQVPSNSINQALTDASIAWRQCCKRHFPGAMQRQTCSVESALYLRSCRCCEVTHRGAS